MSESLGAYRSSVLRCNIGEDECKVCRFLGGSVDKDDLLHVISVLDAVLADREDQAKILWGSVIQTEQEVSDE